MKLFKSITNCYNKMSVFGKILLFVVLLLIVVSLFKKVFGREIEGFTDETRFLFKNGDAIYDDFYASVYDFLVFNQLKNDYEVGVIINSAFANEQSVIADIGCGTGHHVNELTNRLSNDLSIVGIDRSPAMIQKAKELYPNLQFKLGNALEESLFQPSSLTHILCLYFTIYDIQEKYFFFKNCMQWLMPGGYFIVHLVDKTNLSSPIINPMHPLYVVQQNGTMKTKAQWDDFSYNMTSNIDNTSNVSTLEETFKFSNGRVRKQDHTLYIEDVSTIVNLAQDAGFLLHAKIDMNDISYPNQYLYIFVKPN